MPLSNAERCSRYREKRRAQQEVAQPRQRVVAGEVVPVFSIGDLTKEIMAGYRLSPLRGSAIRATLKRWMSVGAVPASGFDEGVRSARVFTAEQKALIVKVYGRHMAKPMTSVEIGNWLSARWSKVCN